jgi:hypothetical protein
MNVDTTTVIIGTGLFGLALFLWLLCAYLAYQRAPGRGRRAGVWGLLGVLFGPFALFALMVMKPGHVEQAHATGGTARRGTQANLYERPNRRKRKR